MTIVVFVVATTVHKPATTTAIADDQWGQLRHPFDGQLQEKTLEFVDDEGNVIMATTATKPPTQRGLRAHRIHPVNDSYGDGRYQGVVGTTRWSMAKECYSND